MNRYFWGLLRDPPTATIILFRSERSAARLAHQSGGLGVPSSNLGAPTNRTRRFSHFFCGSSSQHLPLGRRWEDGEAGQLSARLGSICKRRAGRGVKTAVGRAFRKSSWATEMFAEPTINDFLDNLRWHLAEAMTRTTGEIARIKAEQAGRGVLNSGMTYLRTVDTVREGFDVGTRTALGELKRAVRITKLNPNDLRQATVQCLNNFSIEAKSLIRATLIQGIPSATVDQNLASFDQRLSFAMRQFDVGFFEPQEPEVPRVHNAINIGAMTGSTIQQGSPGANQAVEFSLRIEPTRAALAAFETAIHGTSMAPDLLSEIVADVQTIKAQLSKPAPSVSIIQEAGKSLRSVLEGVAGGLLTPAVMAAAPTLWSALGLG